MIYTVAELAVILGITEVALRQKMRTQQFPFTNDNGRIFVLAEDFENYLKEHRCWDFTIPEWEQFYQTKREIRTYFTKIQGALQILKKFGISIEQRTLKRWIHNQQIKAYNLGGTYYIPLDILEQDLS
ncbi:helix-turn-helix domain-containing protein [Effusibacillus dendaii]|uniref:Helix-turn-helix domain-containing protein n=1 Tax=Effusibacillus dendaii TaxID=2743772 RepID=A0A7I8DCF1_9BACL|nr:helix-turn-helix domain-containing protein [Effusibacillus dendaii]BCJ87022.1 hypothetical protein skT53_20070 [Effusibacillus dendaii]